MKKSEKRMILILVAILIVVLIIFSVTKNKGKKSTSESSDASADQTQATEQTADNGAEQNQASQEFVETVDGGTKLNTSSKLSETKEFDGFKFENIQLTEQDNQTTLLADVTNDSGKDTTDATLVDVIFLDKDGNEITTIDGIISPLKAGEKTQFNASTTLSYAGAYDFKIVKK